jgi:uncharacterized repeat protein (TIGR01451 family)
MPDGRFIHGKETSMFARPRFGLLIKHLRTLLNRHGSRRHPAAPFRPTVECLEQRAVPAAITVTTSADDTLYQDPTGQLSNGAGQHFYAGDTAQSANFIRRGAIKFNLTSIPVRSTITSVTLTLHESMSNNGTQSIDLHRALMNWGEGTSMAAGGGGGQGGEGAGVQATTNDVTWIYAFFPSQKWNTPGGDFSLTASATTTVSTVGFYQWTGLGLIADVQAWVNNPAIDFGWIVTGNEAAKATAKQFDTKENNDPANRPELTVVYNLPVADLTISVHHSGIFHPGDSADAYTITVRNVGAAATNKSAVTVTDTLPAGLAPTATDNGMINGWAVLVNGQTVTATRSDGLPSGRNYPSLIITVSVAGDAPRSVVNVASVEGGGEIRTTNDTASDPTATVPLADLTISQSSPGTFRQGDRADRFIVSVHNIGPGPSVGSVTITDRLPSGLTAAASDSGTIDGWAVSINGQTITATRDDVLAAGGSYPPLTLIIRIAGNAPPSVVNTVIVSGGGEIITNNDVDSLSVSLLPLVQLQRRRGA